jgi:hypothetical protein
MVPAVQKIAGLALALGLASVALARAAPAWRRHAAAAHDRELEGAMRRLRAFDAERRQSADFAALATWDRQSGADPIGVAELPGGEYLVGILRGADAVVVLDGGLREVQRLAAPRSPSALAVAGDTVLVVGELAPRIARFRWRGGALVPAGAAEVEGVRAIRGLAIGPGRWIYLVEEQRGRLIALEQDGRDDRVDGPPVFVSRREIPVGNGPTSLARVGDRLIVDCLLDHALVIQKLDAGGAPTADPPIRIVHDGPIWSFAAREAGPGALLIAAGGVEDHPLDRTIGAFGYIDSFLYLYRVDLGARRATREASLNLGEQGLAVPKALAFTAAARSVRVSGYGTDKLLEVAVGDPVEPAKVTATAPLVPGTSAVLEHADGALVFADPLLDAWVVSRAGAAPRIVPVPSRAARDPAVRLGEALVFTTLIAPWTRSDGPLSRFTCETCHYEGYADGRIHHTGRDDVHAVTKPLLGLFNNRPHFSRALDPDLTSVAFNEFRVAAARSDHDPWFSLRVRDVPWVAALGVGDDLLTPEGLRRAFTSFLMAFNHRPNPAALGRVAFTAEERAGAAVFRDRCEGCHEARLASDDPASRIPFARWEELTLTRDGPIVWGKAAYEQTGVTPYVHPEGARVPSLRRLYKKYPYFTNGTAKDLAAVLARSRFAPDQFWHDDEDVPADQPRTALDVREQRALAAFLTLL